MKEKTVFKKSKEMEVESMDKYEFTGEAKEIEVEFRKVI